MRFQRSLLFTILILISPGLLLTLAALCFSINSRESTGLDQIDQAAGQGQILYNGFSHGIEAYHRKRYLSVHPEVAIYGSSRAMQFRPYFFNSRFYNLGGVTGNEEQLLSLTQSFPPQLRPRVIIFIADYWQYMNDHKMAESSRRLTGPETTPSLIALPYRLIHAKHISISGFVDTALGRLPNIAGELELFGAMAVLGHKGFGPAGSSYDFSVDPAVAESLFRENLKNMQAGISAGTGIHVFNGKLALDRIDVLASIRELLADQGTELIVISPPVSPALYRTLTNNPLWRAWLDDWNDAMQAAIPGFRNFLNPASLGSPNCEFLDSWHGGEVTSARMVAAIADNLPATMVTANRLDEFIRDHAGETLVASNGVGKAIGYKPVKPSGCW